MNEQRLPAWNTAYDSADVVAAQEREQLRLSIIEGCREMTNVYLEIAREYHALEEEAYGVLVEQLSDNDLQR